MYFIIYQQITDVSLIMALSAWLSLFMGICVSCVCWGNYIVFNKGNIGNRQKKKQKQKQMLVETVNAEKVDYICFSLFF